jgi:hypothetical protein
MKPTAAPARSFTPPPFGTLQRKCACGGSGSSGGECEGCKKKKQLQRSAAGRGPETVPPIVHEVLHSPGQPLDDATRAFFEPRFGHDFSKVRLHTGSRAAESANAVQARAYTAGREIVFGADQYQSGTAAGSALLAHELTHVVQQGLEAPTAGSPRGISSPTDAAEREAESVGRASLSGKVAPAMATAPGSLFRLGANPNCSKTEADSLQHGINDALGWLNNATAAMAENPLSDKAQSSLRSNFGATYGVAANAHAIRNKLSFAGSALVRNSYSCAKTATFPKCANECGESAVGTNASTICSEMTLNSGVNELFRAACILHETFHATFADFTGDSYSGWRGHSSSTAGYPGAAPEKNADSYTTLAMDLS